MFWARVMREARRVEGDVDTQGRTAGNDRGRR